MSLRVSFNSRCLLGVGQHDAVVADLDLDDLGDAVGLAVLHLGVLDGARGVGDVRVLDTDAGAEELEPATGTGGFDLRRLERGGFAELLGDDGGKGIDGRGADDADVVPGGLGSAAPLNRAAAKKVKRRAEQFS